MRHWPEMSMNTCCNHVSEKPAAFPCGVGECERFYERRQSCFRLFLSAMCVSKERQQIRLHPLCSCGTIVHQALGDLLDAFLSLTLKRQRPAAQHRTLRHAIPKSLFRREDDGSF